MAENKRIRNALRALALRFLRYDAQPPAALPAGRICYVLEVDRLLDRFVLEQVCAERGWPAPRDGADIFAVRRIVGLFARRAVPSDLAALEPLIQADRAHGGGEDVWFVPVAIFWGRAPQRETTWLRVLLAEDWAFGGACGVCSRC